MNRSDTLDKLSNCILQNCEQTPLLVGVDGVDGSGKSMLASELKNRLDDSIPTFSLSIDSYHHPKATRYKRGRSSPTGFYLDSYDYDAFMQHVINPLRKKEAPHCFPEYFSLGADRYRMVPMNSVILIDGIFLQRKELRGVFDFVIFVEVDFDITLSRMLMRDNETVDGDKEITEMFNLRYRPAQEMYFDECSPLKHADVILDNNDLDCPLLHLNYANKI